MNYRHAFHAGNFGDCVKHALLVWLVRALQRKPAPIRILDTHAGAGAYDLGSGPAERTGEWRAGIGSLLDDPPAALADYVGLVRELGLYPGSPVLIRALLRADDHLGCCELHPEEYRALCRRFARDPAVAVHLRDAWEALGALLPPQPRRGLVLIDPPFEEKDEGERLARALTAGLRRWPTGTFMAWYPIKDGLIGAALARAAVAGGFPKTLRAEFSPYPRDGVSLAGGGLLIVNAPWRLDERIAALCEELSGLLGGGDGWTVDWRTQP